MEGQETDVGHQPQEHPNPFLSVSHHHRKGETIAPGPARPPAGFAHLHTYCRLWDSRAQRLWAVTAPLLCQPLGNRR